MATATGPESTPESPAADFLQRSPKLFESAFGADPAHVEHFGLLMTLRQLVETDLQRVLRPFSLTVSDYQILAILRVQGAGFECAPRQLNETIGLTSAGMTAALDRLHVAGHLERTPHPTDRRSILVRLTEGGWVFAETVCRAVCEHQRGILESATVSQIARNNAQLRQVAERLAP